MIMPPSFKQKLYIVARRRGYIDRLDPNQDPYEFTTQNYDPRVVTSENGSIFIGEHVVEVPLPQGELDLVKLEIKAIEAVISRVRGEAEAKITKFQGAIDNLLAIGHDG